MAQDIIRIETIKRIETLGWTSEKVALAASNFGLDTEIARSGSVYISGDRGRVERMMTAVQKRVFEADAQAESEARTRATASQVSYILDLIAKRTRGGEVAGFMTGPTTRAEIERMSRTEASAYIDSLRESY